MKAVFIRTLTTMFRPINTILYFLISTIGIVVIAIFSQKDFKAMEFYIRQFQMSSIQMFYLLIFFWFCGILLTLSIIVHSSGVFSTEESEGTMRILLSKPIKRYDMVLGKLLGVFVGHLIYISSSVLFAVIIYGIISGMDPDIYSYIAKQVPFFILYGVLISYCVSSVGYFLSSLFKKRIVSIVFLAIFLVVVFGAFPMLRMTISQYTYETFHLYIFDINYHLGQIFTSLSNLLTNTTFGNAGKQIMSVFMGTYKLVPFDPDLSTITNSLFIESNYINGLLLLFSYLGISTGLYYMVFLRMGKKDIS